MKHVAAEYPKEACGLLVLDQGFEKFISMTNKAEEPLSEFTFEPKEYINVLLNYEIKTIVHSHPDSTPEPSEHDIMACNMIDIPYLIISYPNVDSFIMNPGDFKNAKNTRI